MSEEFAAQLAAARDGGREGFAALYGANNPALIRFLTGRVGGAADDIAQETWIAAARGLRRFEGDARSFRAWLFTIAHRQVIQYVRSEARRPAVAADAPALETAAPDDPAATVTARAAAAALVAGLAPELAEILLLRVVAGFDADEVGRIVGKTAGAVRVAQHRALRQIAARLSEDSVTN